MLFLKCAACLKYMLHCSFPCDKPQILGSSFFLLFSWELSDIRDVYALSLDTGEYNERFNFFPAEPIYFLP